MYRYSEDKLIKEHTIPNGYRQTDLNDFPENMPAPEQWSTICGKKKCRGDLSGICRTYKKDTHATCVYKYAESTRHIIYSKKISKRYGVCGKQGSS